MSMGCSGRANHLFLGDVNSTQGDIVPQSCVKQKYTLGNDSNALSQIVQSKILQVFPIHQYSALGWIIESRK